ncbi:tripartite tricarboxylate transporter TctB family protein [Chelativorans sp. AA-79]|uniref:tripartite tricarboxylate transporter TctB family protein n=1 Tax=Chelativorans sp. AA-79 TaxID=3028735 RepID=UPI0023FA221B|nr:tripartite tricarboxylate transporter TctB family protein [Chelativorans sp. AA-79]WEX08731.1 tripartite tricarboxylate transporter TctB family protein [Chelativorans sp. AA-79]
MSNGNGRQLSRYAMEIATAIATGLIGSAVCYGSIEIGIGWSETGPGSGFFPFCVGVLIVAGSLWTLGRTVLANPHGDETFLNWERAKPVLGFFLPLVGFLVVSLLLGLYVGALLYIAAAMIWQGGYRPWRALLSGLAVAVFFYFVFEIGFQVPLLKGPVENWLGIY